jgi:dimethylamine/trimethylamine dehydrogenase
MISSWTVMTDEQEFIQSKLLKMGIKTAFNQLIDYVDSNGFNSRCQYSDHQHCHEFDHLVLVTGRHANSQLFEQMKIEKSGFGARIGDCRVPSSIADAIYSGHKFAREFDEDPLSLQCKRERALLQELPMVRSNPSRRMS